MYIWTYGYKVNICFGDCDHIFSHEHLETPAELSANSCGQTPGAWWPAGQIMREVTSLCWLRAYVRSIGFDSGSSASDIIMITFLTLTCEWNESRDSAVKGTLTFFSRHRHEAHPLLWLLSAKVIGFLLKRSQMVNPTNRIWNEGTKMFEIVDQRRILNELNQNLCTKVFKCMPHI